MKKSGRCSKCEGTRIVHLERVIDATETANGTSRHLGNIEFPGSLWSSTTWKDVAQTEAYVCAGCGFVEEYVVKVSEVPWDQVKAARWHTPG